jgi:holo-[acyl-carrier protein] synthase
VILGLGVDLVELDRVAAALARWGGRLVAKLMDPPEAGRLPKGPEARALALARSIAAKEAASKALGTGWSRGVRWRDVVVELDPAPRVRLTGAAASRAQALGSSGQGFVRLEQRGNLVLAEFRLLS